MNIKGRLARLEAQTDTGNDDLCRCPIDPNETWETCPPEEFARELASNTCRKCGRAKKSAEAHARFRAQLALVYGGAESLPLEQ